MANIQLRPYQISALESLKQCVSTGKKRLLLSMPTASGKTLVFVRIHKHLGLSKKTICLVHTDELVRQTYNKYRDADPTLKIGIEKAEQTAPEDSSIVIASVQTIGRGKNNPRLKKFNPADYDLALIDECHHVVAKSYLNILNHFHALDDDSPIIVVGVTATSQRTDKIGLDLVFQDIAYTKGIRELIDEKYLCPVRAFHVQSTIDIDSVKSHLGDFFISDLDKTINVQERNLLVIKEYKEKTPDTRAIVFCTSVKHSEEMAKMFNEHNISAKAISGETPEQLRRSTLADFESGRLKVITNCQILTEGVDLPCVETVIMARPTKSQLVFSQAIGRGLRLYPGKEYLTVLDVVDNTQRHKLVTTPTLFGLRPEFDSEGKDLNAIAKKIDEVKREHPMARLDLARSLADLDAIVKEVDLFDIQTPPEIEEHSKLTWLRTGEKEYRIFVGRLESLIISDVLGFFVINYRQNGFSTRLGSAHKELSGALAEADQWVKEKKEETYRLFVRKKKWRGEAPSESQMSLLRKFGKPVPQNLTKGEASLMISKLLAELNSRKKKYYAR